MADRRIARTKELLHAALLGLLETRTLDAISVKDVLERAGVSRTAFYSHYRDLLDLAQDIWLSRIPYFTPPFPRLGDYESPGHACTELLNILADELGFFREYPNLAKEITNCLSHSVYYSDVYQGHRELLVTQMATEYGEGASTMGLDAENAARFVISGQFALIRNWLNEGMATDIETMCKMIAYIALHCTAAVKGHSIEPYFLHAVEEWHLEEQPTS